MRPLGMPGRRSWTGTIGSIVSSRWCGISTLGARSWIGLLVRPVSASGGWRSGSSAAAAEWTAEGLPRTAGTGTGRPGHVGARPGRSPRTARRPSGVWGARGRGRGSEPGEGPRTARAGSSPRVRRFVGRAAERVEGPIMPFMGLSPCTLSRDRLARRVRCEAVARALPGSATPQRHHRQELRGEADAGVTSVKSETCSHLQAESFGETPPEENIHHQVAVPS